MNEQEPIITQVTPTNRSKKLFVGVFLLTLIVSVTINIFLLIQKNGQNMLAVKTVCGVDDINKSNDILSTQESPKEPYKVLAEDISKREKWEEDINCRYISFYSAVLNNDAGATEKHFTAIKDLSESGYSLDLRFDNIMSIKSIESIYNQVKQPLKADTSLGGVPPKSEDMGDVNE